MHMLSILCEGHMGFSTVIPTRIGNIEKISLNVFGMINKGTKIFTQLSNSYFDAQ